MTNGHIPKIVYLFGAGATHAERVLACKLKRTGLNGTGGIERGLLARDVSKRVIDNLLIKSPKLFDKYDITPSTLSPLVPPSPDIDVELLISLLEMINTTQAHQDALTIRESFKKDICDHLSVGGDRIQSKLFSSLIEWHTRTENNDEKLLGFLTLNHDSELENALKLVDEKFDYGVNIKTAGHLEYPHELGSPFLLLKLHGSFDWELDSITKRIILSSNASSGTLQWIPPSLNKEYLNYPYNIIHGKAYELLTDCDILRVIGCALSKNNIGLISLLFKTQHKKPKPFTIEIVGNRGGVRRLTKKLGIFMEFEEQFYDKYDKWLSENGAESGNYFLDWLSYKIASAPKVNVSNTTYLKQVPQWIKK